MTNTEKTLETIVLETLLKAGSTGSLNTELAEHTLRYGAVIFNLRALGYEITTASEPNSIRRNTYRYTLVNRKPRGRRLRAKGQDILLNGLQELGGFFTIEDVENVIEKNGLVITRKPDTRITTKEVK